MIYIGEKRKRIGETFLLGSRDPREKRSFFLENTEIYYFEGTKKGR